jgi:hypothetical protein
MFIEEKAFHGTLAVVQPANQGQSIECPPISTPSPGWEGSLGCQAILEGDQDHVQSIGELAGQRIVQIRVADHEA